MAQKSVEFKPDRTSFVTYPYIIRFIYSLIFFAILAVWIPILYLLPVFILLKIYSYISINIRFKKERYIFHANRFIRHSGSIFSDSETELIVKNITHLTMHLPWLQHKLFATGNISVQAAGSAFAEIYLNSIEDPEEFYGYIQKIMQHNGFKLSKNRLVQKEKPHTLGVLFETFKNSLWVLVFVVYIFVGLGEIKLFSIPFIFPIITFTIILALIWLILDFLNLKNRVYSIYNDTITYSEGFLSKNYAIVPVENLADASLTQTVIDRLFGLYDIKLSCQGLGKEILFKNLVNGKLVEKNIDDLISKTSSLISAEKAEIIKKQAYKTQPLPKDTRFTSTFRMDASRTFLPFVILFAINFLLAIVSLFLYQINQTAGLIMSGITAPIGWIVTIWFFMMIGSTIKYFATKYYIKKDSMEEQYHFLSKKHVEFTNDKIMSVIFKESFIDRWFNTCSIVFWSIGSGADITFTNIKKSSGLYSLILEKFGIKKQEVLFNMDSRFSAVEMLKATFFITLFAFILVPASAIGTLYNPLFLIPILVIIFLYSTFIIYNGIFYRRSKMVFYKDYVYFQHGIFFKEFYYVLYDNIKDITTLKYPFSSLGSVTFNVAGVGLVKKGNDERQVPHHFKINFIPDIDTKDELIDIIFDKRPSSSQIQDMQHNIHSYSPKPMLVSKPDLANSLVSLLIASVIIFPLIIILPITTLRIPFAAVPPQFIIFPLIIILSVIITWTVLAVRMRSYMIQPYRVLSKSGILYKKQISIVFSKIDHINQYQGFFNKTFKNGSIYVNTTGSSEAELIISNIKDFKYFYELLKKHY